MKVLLLLLLSCLVLLAGSGCNTMPEEEPGYNVRLNGDSPRMNTG